MFGRVAGVVCAKYVLGDRVKATSLAALAGRREGAQQRASCGCILDCVGAVAGLTAAKSRTLQEGPRVRYGLAVIPEKKAAVPHCEERPGAAHSRRDQECVTGWRRAGGKPRVPHCEERPRAAHSRRDQECVTGWRRAGGKPRVPHCEERPGAAHSRRDHKFVAGWRRALENSSPSTTRSNC